MTDTLTVKDLIAALQRFHPDEVTDIAAVKSSVSPSGGSIRVRLVSEIEDSAECARSEALHWRRRAESEQREYERIKSNADRARSVIANLRALKRGRPLPLP